VKPKQRHTHSPFVQQTYFPQLELGSYKVSPAKTSEDCWNSNFYPSTAFEMRNQQCWSEALMVPKTP